MDVVACLGNTTGWLETVVSVHDKDWGLENNTNLNSIFFDKKIWNCVHFFTCILPDYKADDILKEFWKNTNFENMTAGLLLRCQN